MTEATKRGLTEFLDAMPVEELHNLASAITGGLSKTLQDRDQLTKTVLLHSPSVRSTLLRRAITRNMLFSYLTSKNVALTFTDHTKESLVNMTISHWEEATDSSDKCVARIQAMALEFSAWFYGMFNGDSPISDTHFWRDASIRVELVSGDDGIVEEVDSDNREAVRLLFEVKKKYEIFLKPNLCADGVDGNVDRFGLVVVRACGTVHSNEAIVGVFEQVFALGSDPDVEGNWKIKRTRLKLVGGAVDKVPTLTDSQLDPVSGQVAVRKIDK